MGGKKNLDKSGHKEIYIQLWLSGISSHKWISIWP